MKFPGSIRVKVEVPGMSDSFATCAKVKTTPEATVAFLNRQSQQRKIGATYTLATEEQYQAYRNGLREAMKA